MDIRAFFQIIVFVGLFVYILGMLFVFVARLGRFGRVVADTWSRPPWLDVIISVFTWIPWAVGALVWGWFTIVPVVLGQIAGLQLWIVTHELLNFRAARGPRIKRFLNQRVGWFPNHAALWVTSLAFPVFLFIRLAQVALYPWLVVLLDFPRYRAVDWVSVSRQKFDGLIGHDLIWCLYCDWMTGVYSLGAEMLRNVESFWCPIRFTEGKKCENCRLDFPDIDGGWTSADGTMEDVLGVMKQMYGGGNRAWFGHSTRLTVEGKEPGPAPARIGDGEGEAVSGQSGRPD